jgi:hypothetical protein
MQIAQDEGSRTRIEDLATGGEDFSDEVER